MAEEKNVLREAVDEIKKANSEFKSEVIEKAKAEVVTVKTELNNEIEVVSQGVKKTDAKVDDMNKLLTSIELDIKDIKAKSGRSKNGLPFVKTVNESVFGWFDQHKAELEGMSNQTSFGAIREELVMQSKAAVVTSASQSGTAYVDYLPWQPGMEPTGQTRFRELVRTIQSQYDNVSYPRANNPIGAGSTGRQAAEGDTKAQVDRGYTMIDLKLTAVASWIAVTRQSLRNIAYLSSWLPTSLNEQLLDYEDTDFANTLVASATGSTTGITSAGSGINAENFIKLIRNLIKSKYKPNAIACDPDVWSNMLSYKASTSGEYTIPIGTVNISSTGQMYFLGIPVYPVNWLTGGRVIVGDWTKASIVESEGLSFRMSENVNDQFVKNEVSFLLERVNGLAVYRTNAFTTLVLNVA